MSHTSDSGFEPEPESDCDLERIDGQIKDRSDELKELRLEKKQCIVDKAKYKSERFTLRELQELIVSENKSDVTEFLDLFVDTSDKVKGVKGLGEKGLYKKFPELMEKDMTMGDIYNICEAKFKEHVVYARVIQGFEQLEKNYKIMDLDNPMISKDDEKYLDAVVSSEIPPYIPEQFVAFYNQDKLGGMIRNVEFWVKEIFEKLVIKK